MKHHAHKGKGLFWVTFGIIVGIIFAVGIKPLAHIIPWSWETHLGQALDLTPHYSNCSLDPQAQLALQQLINRIYPLDAEEHSFPISVFIEKSNEVNAFASLGGKIVINSALIAQTESPEELAGILAHEIEHVHHRHIMEGFLVHLFTFEGMNLIFGGGTSAAYWSRFFINMNFTKSQEAQADEFALKRLQKSHVDNRGFKAFFNRLKNQGSFMDFISDHPSNKSRSEMAELFNNENTTPVMTAKEWGSLKRICE
jgi:predicted Zn-dependent protease